MDNDFCERVVKVFRHLVDVDGAQLIEAGHIAQEQTIVDALAEIKHAPDTQARLSASINVALMSVLPRIIAMLDAHGDLNHG